MKKRILVIEVQDDTVMALTKKLSGLDVGMSYYSNLEKDEDVIAIVFAESLYITSALIVEQLPGYLEALRKLKCMEVLDIDLDVMTSVKYWMKNYKLKYDMEALNDLTLHERSIEFAYKGFKPKTTLELYQAIERNILNMVEMLTEVQRILTEAPAGLYENFYLSQKAAIDVKPVKVRYEQWKREVGVVTPELLKDKEMQELAGLLTKKVMRYVVDISYRESGQVDLEALKQYMVNGFEFPKEFPICYARFRRFVKEGETLQLNYDSYGQYLHEAYYKLTPDEHRALIEFDIMLDLIHQEMATLYEAKLPPALATPEAKELMKKAREAGCLDDKFQPKISNTKSAMLADEIASKLQIRNRWKVFEQFWHRHDMYKDNYDGRDQKQSSEFLDEINKVLN